MVEEVEFYRETEFKDTKIGKLPKEWEVRALGEIGELSRGLSYRGQEKFSEEVTGGYLFLTLNSIKEGGGLKEDGWSWIRTDRLRERHFVREGEIVIANTEQSKDGSLLGSPAIVHFPSWYKKDVAAYSMDLSKLQLNTNINLYNQFLFYYLSHVQPLARNYQSGTNVWHLNLDAWSNELLIPIPPLPEQQKIAEILSTVDEAIQKTDEIIAKTERLKRGLMQELLTKGVGHKEFKDTEIGRIPKDWEAIRFGDIANLVKGRRPREFANERMKDSLPYLSAENLRNNNVIQFVKVSGDIILVDEGDLILIWDGSNAGEFFLGKRGVLSSTMVKILLKEKLYDNIFLFYLLKTKEKYLKDQTKGTGIPHVDGTILRNLVIPLPPSEEQQKIAEILSTVDEKLETLRREKTKLERIKQWFMEELLTGRIRVRVA
jgi:type I restriction enzyme S subunit